MVHFKVSAVLPIPAHIFFVERDSAAFRSLVAKVMKLGGLEIHDGWMDGDVEVYKFVTRPDIDKFVPKKLQHYLPGGNLYYIDIIEYDPKRLRGSPYKLNVTSIPPIFPSKAHIQCELTIEEETKDTCRQTLEGNVDIHIFGLGKIAENIIADNLKKVYSGIPQIVERWNVFRQEVLKKPGGKEILVSGRPDNYDVNWINDQIQDLLAAPLEPKYSLKDAPGMRQKLQAGKTARDAEKVVEDNRASTDVDRGFDHPGKAPGNAGAPADKRLSWESTATTATRASQDVPHAAHATHDGAHVRSSVESTAGRPMTAHDARPQSAGQDSTMSTSPRSTTRAADLQPEDVAEDGADSDTESFKDAVEDQPWINEEGYDEVTADQIAEDHKAARNWYRSFKRLKSGTELQSVDIDADVDARARPPLNAQPLKSKRFSKQYQQEYDNWTGYWDEQKNVPEAEHVPELRARLGHLFGLGAAWGLLKPLRSGKHSRGGSRDLAARKDSAASSNKSGNGTAKSPHHAAHDSISSLQEVGEGDLRKSVEGSEPGSAAAHNADGSQKGPGRRSSIGKMFSCFTPKASMGKMEKNEESVIKDA